MQTSSKEASETARPLGDNAIAPELSDSSLAFLRSFRLQALKKQHKEHKQAAIYTSKKLAFVHALPHIFATLAAIILVILNVCVVHVGPISTAGLTALQFAAKLLELLIVGSIAAILLNLIRKTLLGSSPLPFGAIVAPYKVHDLSYLWSVEYLGSFRNGNIPLLTMCLVRLFIPVMVFLAALAGPASAVLLIPRIIDYPYGSTMFLLNDSNSRFPNYVDLEHGLIQYETDVVQTLSEGRLTYRGGWPTSDTEPLTSITAIPDRSGVRNMQMAAYRSLGQCSNTSCSHNLTFVSTFPNKLIGTDVGSTTWSIRGRAHQPFVSQNFFSDSKGNQVFVKDVQTEYVHFASKPYLDNFISYSQLLPNISIAEKSARRFFTGPTYPSWQPLTNTSSWDQSEPLITLFWCSPPEGTSDHSLILVTGKSTSPYTSWHVSASTIDAKWIVVDADSSGGFSSVQDIRDIVGTSPQNFTITISPRWMGRMFDLARNASDLYVMAGAGYDLADLWNMVPYIALAISNIPSDDELDVTSGYSVVRNGKILTINQTSFPETVPEYDALQTFLTNQGLDHGFDGVQLVNGNFTDLSDLAKIWIKFSIRDYGYDYTTITVKLSLVLVGLYALIAGSYVLSSFWGAATSSSWDSVTEIIALALNSEKPTGFERTSVTVDNADTCSKTLNIRANEWGSLEMVFGYSGDSAVYGMVLPNEKYN